MDQEALALKKNNNTFSHFLQKYHMLLYVSVIYHPDTVQYSHLWQQRLRQHQRNQKYLPTLFSYISYRHHT